MTLWHLWKQSSGTRLSWGNVHLGESAHGLACRTGRTYRGRTGSESTAAARPLHPVEARRMPSGPRLASRPEVPTGFRELA